MNNTRIVIEAGRTAAQYRRDLWRYRELLYFLAWRDIAIHYKQTVLGAAWALVRPLSTVLVFAARLQQGRPDSLARGRAALHSVRAGGDAPLAAVRQFAVAGEQ